MKNFLLFLVFFSAAGMLAQDTIYTRAGEVIAAKVYEITATEIKYKKPSNLDGPLYTTSKENVAVIEYKNGSKDVFQQDQSGNTTASSQNVQSQNQNNQPNTYYSPRPRVNVVIAPPPVVIGPGWGYGYYRPYRYYHRRWHRGWGW